MTTYGVVVFEGAEELDFVGPWEVFTVSAMVHANGPEPSSRANPPNPATDHVVLIAQTLEPVRCAKGLRVLPDATFRYTSAWYGGAGSYWM